MKDFALSVDCRDDRKQKRFFPVGVGAHFRRKMDMKYWYFKYIFYNSTQGNLDCCSDTIAGMHYIDPKEMHLLDYLIYHVHPFGLEKNITECPPKRLKIQNIKAASKTESFRRIYEREKQLKRKLKKKLKHHQNHSQSLFN